MAKLCPHCQEELSYLSYSVQSQEWGDYIPEDDDHQQSETDWTGDVEYKCPHCDEEITLHEYRELPDPEEEIKTEPPKPPEEESDHLKEFGLAKKADLESFLSNHVICKCGRVIQYCSMGYGSKKETEVECSCGKIIKTNAAEF